MLASCLLPQTPETQCFPCFLSSQLTQGLQAESLVMCHVQNTLGTLPQVAERAHPGHPAAPAFLTRSECLAAQHLSCTLRLLSWALGLWVCNEDWPRDFCLIVPILAFASHHRLLRLRPRSPDSDSVSPREAPGLGWRGKGGLPTVE